MPIESNANTSETLQNKLDDKANLSGATFSGLISAVNLSGTNTGDQDLSNYALIEDIPTKVSELTNDSGFISEETDPVYNADKPNIALKSEIPTALSELTGDSTHRLVTDTEKSTWNAKQDALGFTPENIATKGVANGYCGLDGGAKVPLNNLPSTLLKYIGNWDASTNTPTLTNPDLTKIGNVYNVSVVGTQFGITFSVGDWLIYNSSGIPEKSDNSDDVVSVNGRTGIVTGLAEDNTVVHLATDETITGGKAFSKGAVFYGQDTYFPTGVGSYVANYYSSAYSVSRVLGYNGSTYQDLAIGAMRTANTFSQRLFANGNVNFGYNVGIGTNPAYQFHVVDPSYGNIRFFDKATNGGVINITSSFGSTPCLHFNGTGGADLARLENNGIPILTVTKDNVGIGTNAPASKLQVVGLKEYADNAAAIAAGLTAGAFYRTGDLLKVVH